MISNRLRSFLTSRLYFLLNGKTYHLEKGRLIESDKKRLHETIFPVVVIGRENYRESSKKYPVTNEKDLRQIIANESEESHLTSPPVFKEDHALIQTHELDSVASDLLSDKWCLWLPETWLLDIRATQLLQVNRGDSCIWGTSLYGNLYTTVASGAFSSPDYFLMSIGASSDTQTNTIPDGSYSQHIVEGFNNLSGNQWKELFKAQKYVQKLNQLFSWPSIFGGLILGYGIFCLADLAVLSYQHRSLDTKIGQQEVTAVIQKQRAMETKIEALSALSGISNDKILIRNMWQTVLTLMEGKSNILRVVLEGDRLQIRIESKDANDALALVQSLDYVETADFSTPVRNSVGNKRVTIALSFKGEESSRD